MKKPHVQQKTERRISAALRLVLVAVLAGVIVLEVWLSRRKSRWPGLIMPALSLMLSLLLVLGGVVYTVGGVLYAVKWPGRDNPRFGCHEIFHLFILAGSICHFLLMYQVIAFV